MKHLFLPLLFLCNLCMGFNAYTQTIDDYRTNGNVTFVSATGWQRYDGTAWVTASVAPTSANNVITIRANSGVNITANITLDQLVVEGFLNINAGVVLTLANGTGDDLTLQGAGAIYNKGTINNCAGGSISPANAFTSTAWASPKGTFNSPDVSEPTTDATLLYFNQSNTTAHIYWQKSGSGKKRVVVLKPNAAVNVNALTDNTVYTANATYGSGSAVDGGFVVFNGVGGQVNVTGLTNATTYHVAVFEYNDNCSNTSPNYKTGSPLASSFLTGIRPFITTWQTSTANETITIPIPTGLTYTCRVDWGDGTFTDYNGTSPTMSRTYATAGTYTISIGANGSTGTLIFPRIFFNNGSQSSKIRSIAQWGSNVWTFMGSAFWGCSNLQLTATDNPNLSEVTIMGFMFFNCTAFTGNSSMNTWNTGAVTNMSSMFRSATAFNQNIGAWNTGAVTNMSSMFDDATAFNQNIGAWNTGAVTNMSFMFQSASAFNQNIGAWNTGAVTNMSYMFSQTSAFNQNIGAWDTGAVTNMGSMFQYATAFNQNIGAWNTGAVTDINYMFNFASAFNQNIGAWNTGAVTNMVGMFQNASAFNQNLVNWNVTGLLVGDFMFNGSGLSTANYDATLIGWASQNVQTGVQLGALGLKYCNGQTARNTLTSAPKSWVITGDALQCGPTLYLSVASLSGFSTNISVASTSQSFTISGASLTASASLSLSTTDWEVSTNNTAFFPTLTLTQSGGNLTGQPVTIYVRLKSGLSLGAKTATLAASSTGVTSQSITLNGNVVVCPTLTFSTLPNSSVGVAYNQTVTYTGGSIGTPTWGIASGSLPLGLSLNNATGVITGTPTTTGSYTFTLSLTGGGCSYTTSSYNVNVAQGIQTITFGALFAVTFGVAPFNLTATTSSGLTITYVSSNPLVATISGNMVTVVGVGSATITASQDGNGNYLPATSVSQVLVVNAVSTTAFVTTWITTTGTITIPTTGSGYNYNITWTNLTNAGVGDGSTTGRTGNYTITGLQNNSTYQIIITGSFPRIYFNDTGDKSKIRTISQWGINAWASMNRAFSGCSNLQLTATDNPNLSGVTDMSYMFAFCNVFAGNSSMNNWNTGAVTNMNFMFGYASAFNQNIGSWNIGAVTNMSQMFYYASAFNQNIGAWNTGAVTNMGGMFGYASVFNQNIGSWNTGAVTNMGVMFAYATAFNQNIGAWNTGAVTNMSQMFGNATAFNQNIGSWNTGAVTNMYGMFAVAIAFNQNIGSWNTGAVTNMSFMFYNATAFNQNIGAWNTGAVTNMSVMFADATAFNQDTGAWNTGAVTDMGLMFQYATAFNQNIGAWNTGAVTNMVAMFENASAFNQPIGSWNTGAVTYMNSMFSSATAFNQNIGAWNTGAVTDMSYMFNGATAFNQNIGAWNTGAVTDMSVMFADASAFNQNIGAWNTGAVTNMSVMFADATAFNQNIGAWNTGAVTDMSEMFFDASAFNQNLANWNVTGLVAGANNGGYLMLNGSGLSTANYDATLIGWASQNVKTGVRLGALGLKYCNGQTARNILTSAPKSWVITGDASQCPPTLALSTALLSGFSTSPTLASASQSFTISGTSLTASASLSLSTTDWEISTNNTAFFPTLTLTQSGGNLTGQPVTIYVRLKSGLSLGVKTATLTASSTGVTSQTVALSGNIILDTPVATAVTAITNTGFTANWNAVTGAVSYQLDVATNNTFTNFVTGYQNLSVTGTSSVVTGVNFLTNYFYRVRAVSGTLISANSNVINLQTTPIENTYFSSVVSIFPNPTQEMVKVQLPIQKYAVVKINILDIKGAITKQIEATNQPEGIEISLKNMTKGLYIFQIESEKAITTKKVVIE